MKTSKVYCYGLLAPTMGGEMIGEQILLAHRYKNTLVKIELDYRAAKKAIITCDALTAATNAVAQEIAKAASEKEKKALRQKKSKLWRSRCEEPEVAKALLAAKNKKFAAIREARDKVTDSNTFEANEAFRTAKAEIIDCEALRAIDREIASAKTLEHKLALKEKKKQLRRERSTEPAVVAALRAAKQKKKAAILAKASAQTEPAAENREEGALYWGTYLVAEKAIDAASSGIEDPKFKRWKGVGSVAVQLQKGLAVEKLLAGHDNRAALLLAPLPVPGRSGKPRPRVRLRIGSDGVKPVWGEWPVIYHRDLPADGTVTWIKVLRKKIAAANVWSLHVTVETEIEEGTLGPKVVALDLRWRADLLGEEVTRRAGEWTNGEEHGVFMLDARVLGGLQKASDIRSIRDKHQNTMHAKLIDWAKRDGLPEAHKEQLARIATWKSPHHFARLAFWWRTNRLEGDTEAYNLLEAWRKRDKHLWLFEAHTRMHAIRRRLNQYRIIAARLMREHSALIVEQLSLDKLALKPEKDDSGQKKGRSQRVETAPSELRRAFVDCATKQGKPIYDVKPGPLQTVWQAWREGHAVLRKKAPARSKRFNRLRGTLVENETAKAAAA